MKRVGGGIVGSGFLAFGIALSFGVVSIGMNAVGWIAIGMNAVGFVSIGAINSLGVFSFGGVNSGGGWGTGLVNAGYSDVVGLALSAAALLVVLVVRVRTWPLRDRSMFVSLVDAPNDERSWALVRVTSLVGSAIEVTDDSCARRVEITPQLAKGTKPPPKGALARVRLGHATRVADDAGYRQDAAVHVVDLLEIVVEREGGLRKMFGDAVGIQLACAVVGMCASVIAFFVFQE